MSNVWKSLQSILAINDWYSKVHSNQLAELWRSEAVEQGNNGDDFDLALSIARATAQGSLHIKDCGWEEIDQVCDKCYDEIREHIRNNPEETIEEYGLAHDTHDAERTIAEYLKGNEWLYDCLFESNYEYCTHPKCRCVCPDHMLKDYISTFHCRPTWTEALLEAIDVHSIASLPDWHPGSDGKVLDIIHPSLNCYVAGVSKMKDGTTAPEAPEEKAYQWLPAEVERENAEAPYRFTSPINNAPETFTPLLGELFNKFVPHFAKVLGIANIPFERNRLQVIVKVGSTILTPDKPEFTGGSWHIEGMPYEHIVATGLCYLRVKNITDSFLEFRKPVVIDNSNIDYPQSNGEFTTHHFGITPGSHHEGESNRYLGAVKSEEGLAVVFPNTLQHRVKEFRYEAGPGDSSAHGGTPNVHGGFPSGRGERTIVAFFLVDPRHRIISTADVPDPSAGITREMAEHHRERLMYHRKFFADRLNKKVYERPYSLCEH